MALLNIEKLQSQAYLKQLSLCIHCGLCLQACPTYSVFGTEMDSPRGRISLMRAVAQGRLDLQEYQAEFSRHIERCLACRACESACPSGVQYGQLVEAARIVTEQNRQISTTENLVRWLGTQQLMPYPARLRLLATIIRIAQRIGIVWLVESYRSWPAPLQAMLDILPAISGNRVSAQGQTPDLGSAREGVMFFTGCIQEAFLPSVNKATQSVLQRNGYQFVIPERQTCCGAAHMHLGDVENAKKLARQNIDAFGSVGITVPMIICNAGGCGLFLKEYGHLLADDPEYADRAREFSARVQDISVFLTQNMISPPSGEINTRATYVDSCHLRHGLKVIFQPRKLLQDIPGLDLIELNAPERCCGSAGVYNLVHPEIANQILAEKMKDIIATGADMVITSNTGCHLQLIAGVKKARMSAKVMHVVEVLELSYQLNDENPITPTGTRPFTH